MVCLRAYWLALPGGACTERTIDGCSQLVAVNREGSASVEAALDAATAAAEDERRVLSEGFERRIRELEADVSHHNQTNNTTCITHALCVLQSLRLRVWSMCTIFAAASSSSSRHSNCRWSGAGAEQCVTGSAWRRVVTITV